MASEGKVTLTFFSDVSLVFPFPLGFESGLPFFNAAEVKRGTRGPHPILVAPLRFILADVLHHSAST